MNLTDKEKRTLARWVDLGGPIDFPTTDGFGYTDDSQLPIISLLSSEDSLLNKNDEIRIGFHDVKSGINWLTLNVEYYPVNQPEKRESLFINTHKAVNHEQVLTLPLSTLKIQPLREYILEINISDKAGNKNIFTKKIATF